MGEKIDGGEVSPEISGEIYAQKIEREMCQNEQNNSKYHKKSTKKTKMPT